MARQGRAVKLAVIGHSSFMAILNSIKLQFRPSNGVSLRCSQHSTEIGSLSLSLGPIVNWTLFRKIERNPSFVTTRLCKFEYVFNGDAPKSCDYLRHVATIAFKLTNLHIKYLEIGNSIILGPYNLLMIIMNLIT